MLLKKEIGREMDGLRVYKNTTSTETSGGYGVFYSRRESGPYYRWCFEEKRCRWCAGRVPLTEFSRGMLCSVTWKIVPASLQKSMVEHYQD